MKSISTTFSYAGLFPVSAELLPECFAGRHTPDVLYKSSQTPQHILQRADTDDLDTVRFSHAADADCRHDDGMEAQFFGFLDSLCRLTDCTDLAA